SSCRDLSPATEIPKLIVVEPLVGRENGSRVRQEKSPLPAGPRETARERLIAQNLEDRAGNLGRRVGLDEDSVHSVPHDPRAAAALRIDRRCGAGHRFDGPQAKCLGVGRKDGRPRFQQRLHQLFPRDMAVEPDALSFALGKKSPEELAHRAAFRTWLILAEYVELGFRVLLTNECPCPQERQDTLFGRQRPRVNDTKRPAALERSNTRGARDRVVDHRIRSRRKRKDFPCQITPLLPY